MLIPWKTDAPLYHVPFGTIGLIAANFLAYYGVLDLKLPAPATPTAPSGLALPQWISNLFVHSHGFWLIGNMAFLWLFGLIVEGKLGWWKFLLVFLGLGLIQSATVGMYLPQARLYLGPSAVLFCLFGIALVWAPLNEVNCVGYILRRPVSIDVPVLVFVGLFLIWDFTIACRSGFKPSCAILHLGGALGGAVLALILLKLNLVECESFDLLSVLAGRDGERKASRAPSRPESPAVRGDTQADQRRTASNLMHDYLAAGRAADASALYKRVRAAAPHWQLSQDDLLRFATLLHEHQLWSDSVDPLADYLRRSPDPPPKVLLTLAKILLKHEKQPYRAARLLAQLPTRNLPPKLAQTRERLLAQAIQLRSQQKSHPPGDGI